MKANSKLSSGGVCVSFAQQPLENKQSSIIVPLNTGFTGSRKGYFGLLHLLVLNSAMDVLKYGFDSFM